MPSLTRRTFPVPSASVTTAISEQRKSIAAHRRDRVQSRRT
jgi:hypothetical protein